MSALTNKAWRGLGWLALLAGAPSMAQAAAPVIAVRLVMTDVQGTPVMKKDLQGHILARYDYRPYGAQQGGPVAAGPGYTGHVNDPDTGLVYMQARYYDPIGRMLSVDPMGPIPGNIYNFNRYGYASNNPISYTDPTGMESESDCSAACMKMRHLSDWFNSTSRNLTNRLNNTDGSAPMGQLNVMSNYIGAVANGDLAAGSKSVSSIADLVPGATLAACAAGESCSATDLAMGGLSILPGEGVEASAAREAYPYIMAGLHGNSAASLATSYLYRLTNSSGDLLKWGISKNPFRRYTQSVMQGKNMQIMTSGSRREMLNLERWIVEHDRGPLNRERWAGKQAGDVP